MRRTYPTRPIAAVGVVVWRDGKILMIRRGKPPRLGEWSLPGGAQHLGETAAAAARREIKEETGVDIGATELLDVIDSIERDARGRIRRHYTLIDFAADWRAGEPRPGGDAAAVGWFATAELATLGLWSETLRLVRLAAARRP